MVKDKVTKLCMVPNVNQRLFQLLSGICLRNYVSNCDNASDSVLIEINGDA